jgi:C1A family cysteine protease
MKKTILLKLYWSLITLVFVSYFQNVVFASDEIKQIKQAIEAKGANWIAGENWVTRLAPEERRRLCGAILEPIDPSKASLLSIPLTDSLPPVFDWRDNNGNWVTSVKNQGNCGSCWDFSAVAQVESWWKIHNANLDSMINLSEQFVLSCSEGTCDGWGTHLALVFIDTLGIPTETCFEYQADDEIPCSDACSTWADEAITIPGWGWITLEEDIIDNIKNAVYRHPVSASFTVYTDFLYYSGGVYEHVWGEEEAGHAILIVGWDDAEQSWICKNSWGEYWGVEGYFRIKWSNCGIGSYMPFIWDEMAGSSALTASTDQLDLSLIFGDSITKNITLKNLGSDLLQYSAMDYEVPVMFHPDSFMAWDNMSWWCGDPQIGGYSDHWLQYLQTPVFDLSNTNSPELSWMGFWSIEDPSGTEPPWDGWDGCNVWVSIDSGNTFNVAYPISPQYNCQSMWSFGHPEQGWNLGVGVPGWGSSSSGWIPVTFDLSPYKSENVIIRFAMASDLAFSVQDDSTMYGFFVDEINVSDGSQLIFENHGEDLLSMKRIGRGFELADWLDITNGFGAIQPNDSTSLDITFNTRNLTPGYYYGVILINSNDTTVPSIEVPLNMDLRLPDHDIAIEEVWLPGETIPILFPFQVGAKIKNCGINDASNFYVACNILSGAQTIYGDTAHVPLILSGASKIVKFKSFMALEPKKFDFVITLLNLTDDYNAHNNINRSSSIASNLVDGFETETGFWNFKGGWGITNRFGGYNGSFCAHVNSGSTYLNNMDATMTFTPGFDLTSIEKATLKFWTRYVTEANKDICYMEASGDSLTWTKLDSLSGMSFSTWTQHEVGLTDFINTGYTKVWIRFHFVSDSSKIMLGVLIDDVEIYPENPTYVVNEGTNESIPTKWKIFQNYPNPFNMTTRIEYSMPKAGDVKIVIYNIKGEVVRNLLEKYHNPGHHFIEWDGYDNKGLPVGTGIYFYHLEVKGKFSSTKKMILMK